MTEVRLISISAKFIGNTRKEKRIASRCNELLKKRTRDELKDHQPKKRLPKKPTHKNRKKQNV